MLLVNCAVSEKNAVRESIIKHFAPVALDGTGRLEETSEGFKIQGDGFLYWGDPEIINDELVIPDGNLNPTKMIKSIKDEFPDIDIHGSIVFGGDSFREYYWFESAPGDNRVFVDKAVDCDNIRDTTIGYPLSKCAYMIRSGYGVFAIKTEEDFVKAAKVLEAFKAYASTQKGKIGSIWETFTSEDHDEFDCGWENLYGAKGYSLKMNDKFIDDFFSKYEAKNHDEEVSKSEESANEDKILAMIESGLDVGEIAEILGLSEETVESIVFPD